MSDRAAAEAGRGPTARRARDTSDGYEVRARDTSDGYEVRARDTSDGYEVPEVRVKCAVCGAHTTAWQGHALTGECGNCGSYDVRPLPRPPHEPRP